MDSKGLNSIYPNPDQPATSPKEEKSLEVPNQKGGGAKTFFIILLVLLILLAAGYFIYQKYFNKGSNLISSTLNPSPKPTTVLEGQREKISVVIPNGYSAIDFKGNLPDESTSKIIYNPNLTTQQEIQNGVFRGFTVIFLRDNDTNNVEAGAAKIKDFLEKLKQKSGAGNTITRTTVAGLVAYKSEGQGASGSESQNMFFTDYYLITEKSIFVVGRGTTPAEPNFAQKEFDEILNSVKISPK